MEAQYVSTYPVASLTREEKKYVEGKESRDLLERESWNGEGTTANGGRRSFSRECRINVSQQGSRREGGEGGI